MNYPPAGYVKNAAGDPLTEISILREIFVKNKTGPVICALAGNPSIDSEILDRLVSGGAMATQYAALSNPKITLSAIKQIVIPASYDKRIDASVSALESISEIYEYFVEKIASKTSFPHVLLLTSLLRNPNIPSDFLHEQLDEPSYKSYLTADIFEDPRIDMKFMEKAAYSRHSEERAAVASNPSLPVSLLKVLAYDRMVEVGAAAKRNLNFPLRQTARMHIEMFDSYSYRPSLLKNLETKADQALAELIGDSKDWDGLPLRWKLQMIAS